MCVLCVFGYARGWGVRTPYVPQGIDIVVIDVVVIITNFPHSIRR